MATKETPLVVLETVRALVDALGGTKATAEMLGVLPSTVSNWLAFDCIPPKRFLAMAAKLKPLGLEPSPKLFRENQSQTPSTKNHEAADV